MTVVIQFCIPFTGATVMFLLRNIVKGLHNAAKYMGVVATTIDYATNLRGAIPAWFIRFVRFAWEHVPKRAHWFRRGLDVEEGVDINGGGGEHVEINDPGEQ